MRHLSTVVSMLLLPLLAMSHHAFSSDNRGHCLQLFNDAEYSKAIAVCQQAAEDGAAAAQTVLGEMYDLGQGIEADQGMAARWWQAASAQSYLPAQNLLASKYYYGGDVFGPQQGWTQDYQQARELWEESAFKGVETSQFMLGVIYMEGRGVKPDNVEAYAWFKLAYQGGYKLATDTLVELSPVMSAQQRQAGLMRLEELKRLIAHNAD